MSRRRVSLGMMTNELLEERAELIAMETCPMGVDEQNPCSDCIRQARAVLSVIDYYGWKLDTGIPQWRTEWEKGQAEWIQKALTNCEKPTWST